MFRERRNFTSLSRCLFPRRRSADLTQRLTTLANETFC